MGILLWCLFTADYGKKKKSCYFFKLKYSLLVETVQNFGGRKPL